MNIAISTGEPAGVGPELTARAVHTACLEWPDVRFTVFGDCALLAERAAAVQVDWAALQVSGRMTLRHTALRARCTPGQLDTANSRYVLALLDHAIDGAMRGEWDALVTAPLQKSILLDAGIPFTGHTEYLAHRTGAARVVMMLVGHLEHFSARLPLAQARRQYRDRCGRSRTPSRSDGGDPAARPNGEREATPGKPLKNAPAFRVALATTHLPLKEVSAALSIQGLIDTLRIIDADMRRYFDIATPRIYVTGLNPHAGEGGYLGHEEIEVITPALQAVQAVGIDARGPYPADTIFTPRRLAGADCVLTMYHDQGLPALKYATFGKSVNITLGLPVVRTSVDHGTALDLAGTGRADPGSLIEAIGMAIEIARQRRRLPPNASGYADRSINAI